MLTDIPEGIECFELLNTQPKHLRRFPMQLTLCLGVGVLNRPLEQYSRLSRLSGTGNCVPSSRQNIKLLYTKRVIDEISVSATMYNTEEQKTKTDLIKLFSTFSENDIWSAMYYNLEHSLGQTMQFGVEL